MKTRTLRTVIAASIFVVVCIGFFIGSDMGTLSAIGWGSVSLLCPLGALAAMLASKTIFPRALISLCIAIVGILLLARAFCAWACPVPLVERIRDVFSKKPAVSRDERNSTCAAGCAQCMKDRPFAPSGSKVDARHFVLGGSLLSAAIFGFPVFCLICPIGLSFATVLLLILLFTGGDLTWSVVIVPVLLLVEVVFFKKWCGKLCPLGALMSLVGKGNKTFVPAIDESACLESKSHVACDLCGATCPSGIDVRHPERGVAWCECTKCRECVDVCPTQAISMPFLMPRAAEQVEGVEPVEDLSEAVRLESGVEGD